ncbi:MAG TPA: hypothetical protein PLL72_10025 [Burkholderiaceae bacterium]|nr:hypothetical protein [Burkholderiaceae bacterium]
MPEPRRQIAIHAAAPPKPAWGAACNGCGLCCLVEPCPIGRLVSARRHGACRALVWDEATACYRCGVLAGRRERLPVWLRPLGDWLQRRAARWIAAGAGCDCDFELED